MDRFYYKPLKCSIGAQLIRKNYLWGLINKDGQQLLDYVYDYIEEEDNGSLTVNYDGHLFSVKLCKLPLPYHYSESCNNSNLGIAKRGNKYGLIDTAGNILIPIEQDSLKEIDGYFIAGNSEKLLERVYQVYDNTGRLLSDDSLSTIKVIDDLTGESFLLREALNRIKRNYGNIWDYGELKSYYKRHNTPKPFASPYKRKENVHIIERNGKYGVEGVDGEIIVPCEYNYIPPMNNSDQSQLYKKGYLICKEETEDSPALCCAGLIAYCSNDIIVPFKYSRIRIFEEDDFIYDESNGGCEWSVCEHSYDGPILFSCIDSYGGEDIIDAKGNLVYSTKNGRVKMIEGDTIIERNTKDDSITIFSKSQNTVVARYKNMSSYENFYLQVLGDNGWGLFDIKNQKEIISCKYSYNRFFFPSEGLIPARLGELCGYIDMNENWVITPRYVQAKPFTEGLAPVANKDAWGFIDKDARVIINFNYDDADNFSDGLAAIKFAGRYFYIDYSATIVGNGDYAHACPFNKGTAAVETKDGYGTISKSGRRIEWNKTNRYDTFKEWPSYETYAGTYAQDIRGWSDQMIDDVLDGDPDLIWNID